MTSEKASASQATASSGSSHGGDAGVDPATHRRVLQFVNAATRPEDLMSPPQTRVLDEGDPVHEDDPARRDAGREQILDREAAEQIIEKRDRHYPLGLRHLRELVEITRLDGRLERFLHRFSDRFYGRWDTYAQPIPRRGPGTYEGVVHAALLHTGKVLFVTADETTLLWDPANPAPSSFEDPLNQPHTMPAGYSQLCGHHVFLSDGKLLSVGGGGYGPNALARAGYKFDPVAKTWSRTANDMSESKWYPTAVALGDQRVLVTCGNTAGSMDIYDEATDTFAPVSAGDTRGFPNLYPGMHLLPSHAIIYSRTGWASAGAGGGASTDSQSAYFTLTGPDTGSWQDIAAATPTTPNRAKGMSVMLHSSTPPYVRVMVIGGVDATTNDTYEILDASVLSPAVNWGAPIPFPDGQNRSLASAVLLPDGNVFVCGGVQTTNSACAMFDPVANMWSPLADLPSIRDYHSVALLLPSGQVMVAGWNNTTIELFDPPYLSNGPRPTITVAPSLVHHGQSFTIESPEAAEIVKVVLVRPMAVTHQTDTEQRVLEMPYVHDHANPTHLGLTAPDGGHPHSLAPQGYYMMFAVSNQGVPSVATWIYLH
jgi:hypothetical protein